ncbi:uncharacterized protein LOC128984436 [Macrosteles quadrilineatus]|uniref:uncharacterized protein LOC128984436 n=1 Tax=Macrosteles quadrilineatus TaxID=74068 RepID=UPI0023E2C19C|nr:uncharacterized protein LOC128984436 [Macrosteles quadrilineatus]
MGAGMAVSKAEGSGGLGLMSCVREPSPTDLTDAEHPQHEPKKRRFRPLRGLRRMFRRKERRPQPVTVSADELSSGSGGAPAEHPDTDNRRRYNVPRKERRPQPVTVSADELSSGSGGAPAEHPDTDNRRRYNVPRKERRPQPVTVSADELSSGSGGTPAEHPDTDNRRRYTVPRKERRPQPVTVSADELSSGSGGAPAEHPDTDNRRRYNVPRKERRPQPVTVSADELSSGSGGAPAEHPDTDNRRRYNVPRKERRPQPVTVSADELSSGSGGAPVEHPDTDNRRRSGSGLHSGLSLSHDSVFSPETRQGQDLDSSSSLSMQRLAHANTNVQAELVDAVRRRRAREETSDDEDLGLPRSPASSSPTAATPDHLHINLKETVSKSNHSTCSDGSLLSMGSSEMDEDSYGQSSGHGSKISLHEKKSDSTEVEVTSAPLSHSAARHKMSVKPKRNHGVPRKRRSTQLGEVTLLPSTPEVVEESPPMSQVSTVRSVTPDPDLSLMPDSLCCCCVGTAGGGNVAALYTRGGGRVTSDLGEVTLLPSTPEVVEESPPMSQLGEVTLLPSTPEVVEESPPMSQVSTVRSVTPDPDLSLMPDSLCCCCVGTAGGGNVAALYTRGGGRVTSDLGEVTLLPSTPEVVEESPPMSQVSTVRSVTPDPDLSLLPDSGTATASPSTQLKSASLPLGAAPAWDTSAVKLSRSKSSATNKQLDSTTEQDEPESLKKEDTTFFGRLLSRRSGKKKKTVEEPPLDLPQKRMDEKGRYVHEVTKLGRHHPASRQRVEPINISQDRSVSRMRVFYPPSPPPPDSPPKRRKEETFDDESILEGRSLKKIIPLEVDSSIPKRTFVKKSQSFRRDEALPFVSLDTPSLPIGLGAELQKDEVEVEDLNELTTMEVVDHHLTKDRVETEEKEVTTTVKVTSSEETDSCDVTVTTKDTSNETLELNFKKSSSLNSINGCDMVPARRKSASSESVNHQMTIPVGSSVVNITQTINEPCSESPPPPNVKPEPRRSLIDGNKDVPNFYPVPAPRLSKRESLESKPPRVPEFLRVQLNHVDREPSVNVVLSTSPGSVLDEKTQDEKTQDEKPDEQDDFEQDSLQLDDSLSENVKKPSRPESLSISVEVDKNDKLESTFKKVDVVTTKEPTDPNQVRFIHNVKQWSAPPYLVSNPNYSIVSIAPRNIESKKSPEKPNILTQQSIQKTVIIKEVKEKSPPVVDKSQDLPPIKPVLRQRSFVSEEKPANILNCEKPAKTEDAKFVLRKKSLPKEVFVSEFDKSRKLSLERLDSRNIENMSDFSKRKSREMSSSEDNIVDRNSYGSSDTLASQDSGDVVLRRKSLSRDIIKQKEEEPELLKVFARRSLKVKDCDIPDDIDPVTFQPLKSRDSDKENECGDSPPEERKKMKDHLADSKVSEKTVPSVTIKYQRSASMHNEETHTPTVLATSKKDNNAFEKRQRSRTIPDPKIIDPPTTIVTHKVIANIFKEKEVEVISLEKSEENNTENEENVPRFKKIQQRKEEWEKRAQMAMKKTHP